MTDNTTTVNAAPDDDVVDSSCWLASADESFAAFDEDVDDLLSPQEFAKCCRSLFRNDSVRRRYELPVAQAQQIFEVFDRNADGFIDRDEYRFCYEHWIRVIVQPTSALLVIDVQNDFVSGTMNLQNCPSKHDGEEVIAPINRLLETVRFDATAYSMDWHPDDHIGFIDNVHSRQLHETSPIEAGAAAVNDTVIFAGPPPTEQRLWPKHCVQNTWGAELHKDLRVAEDAIIVHKGTDSDVDAYSAFWDNCRSAETGLNAQLRERSVTDVFVCGVAYDVCVGHSALHAVEAGFRTVLVEDCSRGVDLEDIDRVRKILRSRGVVIVNAGDVETMVTGRDRRPELGYALAMSLAKKTLMN